MLGLTIPIPQYTIPIPQYDGNTFKQNARIKAIDISIQMKPSAQWDPGLNQWVTLPYDVLAEADIIYNWLIKET